ncbi:hypothetical protein [Azospirillum endophyticum]
MFLNAMHLMWVRCSLGRETQWGNAPYQAGNHVQASTTICQSCFRRSAPTCNEN